MAEDKKLEETSVEERQASQNEEGAPDFSKKHPLEHSWTLWFDNPTTKQSVNKWGQTMRTVYTFSTVEDFWCLYNNVRTPSQLQPSATFYMFKEDIEPKWEHPKNTNGGCWTATIPRTPATLIDVWWLNSILACIGEQFTESDELCGIAVNIRAKANRIELWTKTASNEAVQMSIGKQLKQFLDIGENTKLGYGVFSEKLSAGTKAKDRYQV